jgi:Activator of Hsp90 ATPase homolog 1-like protein
MNPTETVTPIVKTLELSCSRDHAFFVYTERIADWWPVGDFSVTGAQATVIIEGRIGGRILEVDPDGVEHSWGEIDTWDPTGGLGHTWHPGTDPALATRVEVTFTSTVSGCEVTLVHSGWAPTPEAEQSRWGYDAGWDEVLAAYMSATG